MGFSHIDVRCALQPHALRAATPHPPGCNPTPSRLQPRVSGLQPHVPQVCYALRGWHARSFDNYFPAERKAARRVCASVLEVSSAERPATLMVMALQPTKLS